MLATPEFWVAAAFFIFMAIVWRMGAFASMFGALDGRGKRIRAELDEAKRLREEAAKLLADYKRRQTEAEAEAQAIVAGARQEAERLGREAHERMTDFVTRRTAAAEAKIAQAEVQAAQQVRAAAAEAAIKISETVLRDQLRGPQGEALMTKSLSEIRTRLHS